MNIETNEIYAIKTGYGDEVVAKIISEESDHYVLSSPLSVIAGPQGVQMISAVITAAQDKDVVLFKQHCAMICLARQEVADGYIQTTTGIKPVSNKILMG